VKRTTFSHNWLLASLVEKIQAVDPPEIQPEVEEGKCQRHGERFHYFCEHDGEFLCVVCRESKDHKFHSSSLIEEAAQNYQVGIWDPFSACLYPQSEEFSGSLETVTCSIWLVSIGHPLHLSEQFRVRHSRFKELSTANAAIKEGKRMVRICLLDSTPES
jgi:hypothetical protein